MNFARLWNWFLSIRGEQEPSLGKRGERRAARYLKKLGYKVLARGHRNHCGEIDLVMRDGQVVVFVEVKTRESSQKGDPTEAVTAAKQHRICRAAAAFIKRNRLSTYSCRFDVVSIIWPDGQPPQIEHYINAFQSTL